MSKIASKTLSNALRLQEERLAITAHNLANAATSAYRTVKVSFKVPEPVSDEVTANPVMPLMTSYVDFSRSVLSKTDGRLDAAIEGQGFFVIDTPQGQRYTRSGRFVIDGVKRLATSTGGRVMGLGGEIIVNGPDMAIEPDGAVTSGGQKVGHLRVVNFNNKELLQPTGGSLFAYRGKDTGIVPAEECRVLQGYLEESNVNVMTEMANLIDTQRSFEAYDKAMKMVGDTSKLLIDLIAK
jgi:flagellar basal-body rod protein FlgF